MNIFEEFIQIVNDNKINSKDFYEFYNDLSINKIDFDKVFQNLKIELEHEDNSVYFWRDWEVVFKISKNNNTTYVKLVFEYDPNEGIDFQTDTKFTEVEKTEKMFIVWPDKKESKNNQDCKICKGTRKVILFINTVDCECLK